jgi:hypothetical protein
MNVTRTLILAVILGLVAGNSVFAQTEPAQDSGGDTKPDAAEATSDIEGDSSTSAGAEAIRHKDRAVSIMDQPLDGSSFETFTAGLEALDEQASEKDYRKVMSALDYLLFYDIGAKRNKTKLYSNLDGMTPNELLERVGKTRQGSPRKRQ